MHCFISKNRAKLCCISLFLINSCAKVIITIKKANYGAKSRVNIKYVNDV